MTNPLQTDSSVFVDRKPRDDEVDAFGLTHVGKVRTTNQDHFLLASLRRQVTIHRTSLPSVDRWAAPERLAFLAVVADGVGSSALGEEASRHAVEGVMAYVIESVKCYYMVDQSDDEALSKALATAAMRVHGEIAAKRDAGPERAHGMATTLTLWLGVWPRAHLLQVGDSRCYILRDGQLSQISRDQTMAQEFVDMGLLSPSQAERSPMANVLSSAIGSEKASPVLTHLDQAWGSVGLLCSDGLTKHVSDERIAERLRTMTSAQQVCEALLQDALDDGGSDNITIVVGRAVPREGV